MRRLSIALLIALGSLLLVDAPAIARFRHRRFQCVRVTASTPASPSVSAMEITPAAQHALLEMMRSESAKSLGIFDERLVAQMANAATIKQKDGWYYWTPAYRLYLDKSAYVLFVNALGDPPRPPLQPHPFGFLLHLAVYEGSFEIDNGRLIATIPKYKYTLLD